MLTWIYWFALGLYAAFAIYLGWRGYRRSRKKSHANIDFWAADRNLNSRSVGLSISASFMSISWSCVYAVQLVYWYGLSALWLLAIPWLMVMVLYFILTGHFRKQTAFSQPEMLAQRFGDRIRTYFAIPLAFVFLVWGGAEIFAAAQILAPILDAPFHLILFLIAVVVAIYSFLGGFAAVVMTDKLQFALVAFFVTAIAWVAVEAASTVKGFGEFMRNIPAPPKHGSSPWALFATGPALILITLVAYLPGWLVETDIWVRLQAAHSTPAAKRGVLLATLNSFLFLAVLPLAIGLAALYLYPPQGAEIPAVLSGGAAIFGVLIADHTSPLLALLLIIGLAAASMSTTDTCGNVVALSLSYDVIEPYLGKKKVGVDGKLVARWISAAAILLAYIYAIFTESLWDIFYLSSGILTTTIFIPMVSLFLPKVSKRQIVMASSVGFISTLILYFAENRGYLAIFEPQWMADTGLGYIIWALALSSLAFIISGTFNSTTGKFQTHMTTIK